jgi:hypothetical protein
MIRKAAYLTITLWLAVSLAAPAQNREKKAPAGKAADSLSAVSKADSTLARTDSALVLEKELSAQNYMSQREKFNYPRSSREDPFNFPMGKATPSDVFGPIISELLLTGVLYTSYGPKIAIMSMPNGDSFLLREGDMLGIAEVISIQKISITFRMREFGQVRDIVIELKPLAEENDAQSPEAAGAGSRQVETQEEYDESGGPPPQGR